MKSKKVFKRSVWTLLTVFFALLLAILLVVEMLAGIYASWIDQFFSADRYSIVETGDGEAGDSQYFVSDFAMRDENGNPILTEGEDGVKRQALDWDAQRANSLDVDERAAEEGAVLLWNKNGALPLAQGSRVSVLSLSSYQWHWKAGASNLFLTNPPVLSESLKSRGLVFNEELIDVAQFCLRRYTSTGGDDEAPWDYMNEKGMKGRLEASLAEYGDAVLYTIYRQGGENSDMPIDYLTIKEPELEYLTKLCALKQSGKISRVVLLLCTSGPIWTDEIADLDIDACLWVGSCGNAATDAVADLLVGNANPSGHLPDTWPYRWGASPSDQNFGHFVFSEMSPDIPVNDEVPAGGTFNSAYVVYQEGIYVGYRYFETRYEDLVLGGRNAESSAGSTAGGNWNYSDEVAFPFGYGLSYTTFEYSGFAVEKTDGNYRVTVTVRNTGSLPGKNVVQVYLQKPYTDYDKATGIEKAAVELVGFVKTGVLEPGASQTVTVDVSEYEFKSYDSYGYKTYILEKGDYWLAVGTDAHNALNNILAAKGHTTADGMDAAGNGALVYRASYAEDDFTAYAVSPFTGNTVTNQFDDVDLNLYAGTADQKITYLSRSNWGDTYPSPVILRCTDPKMVADMQYSSDIIPDPDAVMPLYNTVTSPYGKLTLIQLKGLPYDDPLWDDLLNEMTYEEQVDIMRMGGHNVAGAASIAAPGFMATDGPCGLAYTFIKPKTFDGREPGEQMSFPSSPILAATFNLELIEELGAAFGEEILRVNAAGIYGPGTDIHRNILGGRGGEYFSEDGFLSGEVNAAESRGLWSKGCVTFTKHFVANEQETMRTGITTWINEQALREIYLKAFETAVTDGGCQGIMTSFNRIGCTWTGRHAGLLTGVLRDEWGYMGFTETDAGGPKYMGGADTRTIANGLIAGNDMWMGSVPATALDSFRNDPTVMCALRESVHRILYVQLQSAAMNGLSSNTKVVELTPVWELVLNGVTIGAGVLAAACLAMTLASWAVWTREEKSKRNS